MCGTLVVAPGLWDVGRRLEPTQLYVRVSQVLSSLGGAWKLVRDE